MLKNNSVTVFVPEQHVKFIPHFFFLLYISSSFPLFFSAQSDLRPSSSRDASATLLLSNCFHGYKVAPCLTPTLPPPEVASVRVLLCVHFLQPGDDVSVLRRV